MLKKGSPWGVRHSGMPLYGRVLLVNAAVLVVAGAVLSLTPAQVPAPLSFGDVAVLVGGLSVMVVANAVLLRVSFAPLARVLRMMETIDLLQPQRLSVSGGTEIRALIETFNEMLDRLEAERHGSSSRALQSQERERRRIGQELHDEIGQRLTGVLLQLKQVAAADPDEAREGISEVQEAVRDTLDEVGRIAWRLRPGVLDDLGLVSALDSLVTSFEEQTGLGVDRRLSPVPALGWATELTVYRIAQESLTNAAKHADATWIEVVLEQRSDGVRLLVADNGCGLAGGERVGSGIRGMRERALSIGADLLIGTSPGSGVVVALDVKPIEDNDTTDTVSE
jgi:two-component system sensor histidine kinase UhpB